MRRAYLVIAVMAGIVFLFNPAWAQGEPEGQQAQLQVVATSSIIGDLVANIAGDRARVEVLIPRHEDAHGYRLRPSDLRQLARADIVFAVGGHMESFLGQLAQEKTLTLINELDPMRTRWQFEEEEAHEHPALHKGEKAPKTLDPHFWHDLKRVQKSLVIIADALIELDPAGKDYYASRLADYSARVAEMDKWFRRQLKKTTSSKRLLISARPAFYYLGESYKIEVVSVSGLSQHPDMSVKQAVKIGRFMRMRKVKVLFNDENKGVNPIVDRLAEVSQAKVLGPLYADSLGPEGTPAEEFLGLFRHNAELMLAGFARY